MKRIFLLIAVIGMTIMQGCEGPDGPQGPPGPTGTTVEAEVFEIRNVNFTNDGVGNYAIVYQLLPPILNSDMILVYRLKSFSGADVWESLPKTYYFTDGEELDYNFDFTTDDILISIGYTNPSVLTPQFVTNQIFRVVVIPGYLTNKITTTDFSSVKNALKLTESDFTESARK